jgi:thioesterase domain-containing protein/acyl carrier protein
VHRSLPAEIASHVRLTEAGEGTARFDVTLTDAAGAVCVAVTGFRLARLDGALALRPPAARDLAFDEADGPRPLSPAEERLRETIALGIPPAEGGAAFDRALAAGLPRLAVTTLDPEALARLNDAPAPPPEARAFDTGGEASDPPQTDLERTIAGYWQDLLGVARVGRSDSFFDLGGHSLIAVRLFAQIRRAFGADFPISTLFEAPTVAALAALIEARTGRGQGAAPQAAPAASRPRFTHLVPMHQGEGGPGQPFYLVAGMFGNVLNLRHLAQLLGGDRPFYGLQARGLLGEDAPHRTLPEAAAAMIAEIRQVQPTGPYLIGGFSGGGLTAWEMARQLTAAGEAVTGLVLLDTPLPVRPVVSRADRLLIKLQEVRAAGLRFIPDYIRAKREWRRTLAARAAAGPEDAGAFHNRAIEAAFRAALPVYDLQAWDGPVALIRPPLDRHWRVTGGRWVSRAREFVTEDNGWSPFAPDLTVIEVPGDHDSMVLEPNVRVLAARLRAWIAAREARHPAMRAAAE